MKLKCYTSCRKGESVSEQNEYQFRLTFNELLEKKRQAMLRSTTGSNIVLPDDRKNVAMSGRSNSDTMFSIELKINAVCDFFQFDL